MHMSETKGKKSTLLWISNAVHECKKYMKLIPVQTFILTSHMFNSIDFIQENRSNIDVFALAKKKHFLFF